MADMNRVKKQSMGRQKIQIKKIEKKSSLEVTFSKRRTGLFKKAGELCVLCGAEAAVIVFSPGRRAFVFGHPSADAVIDRFLHRETNSRALVPVGQVHGYVQRQYLEAPGGLEVKREQEETVGGDGEGGFWWDAPIENMGLNELEQFRGSLEELRKKVADRVEEMTMMMMMESCPSSTAMVGYAAPPQEYNSSGGVLHGHDLAANGVPHGFASSTAMVGYAAPPQEYNSSGGVLHGHDLAAHGVPHGFASSTAMVGYAAPPQEYNSSGGVLHGHDLAAHGVPHGFDFGFGYDEHLS